MKKFLGVIAIAVTFAACTNAETTVSVTDSIRMADSMKMSMDTMKMSMDTMMNQMDTMMHAPTAH